MLIIIYLVFFILHFKKNHDSYFLQSFILKACINALKSDSGFFLKSFNSQKIRQNNGFQLNKKTI